MKLLSLTVEHFRCVRKSTVEFGPGLNVLHGPNDLGKSSLAAAIRVALLLQVSSREHQEFLAWDSAGDPYVELVFESEPQRIWRVRKTFGDHPQAFLEESRDGVDFHVEARGRDVDGRLSEILRWGLAPPGGRGRPKGMPVTFLSTALMAEQDQVAAIFGQALSMDSDESGKKRVLEALQAAAEDPLFKAVLDKVQENFDKAFVSSGQKRRGKESPWLKQREQIQQAEEEERQCNQQLQRTTAIESELQDLLTSRLEREEALRAALETLDRAEDDYKRSNLLAEIVARLKSCKMQLSEITAVLQKKSEAEVRFQDLDRNVARLVSQESDTKNSLIELTNRADAAREHFRVQSEDRLRERQLREAMLERRKAEILGEQARIDVSLNRVRSIGAIAERAQKAESSLLALTNTMARLTREYEESATVLRVADEGENTLLKIGHFLRGTALRRGIEEAKKGLAQVDAWREEASQSRNTAAATELMVNRARLPTPEEAEGLLRLEQKLQIARARLEVGLHLRIQPKRELQLSYFLDGKRQEESLLPENRFERNASREIQLEIDGVTSITVSGGAADARKEVDQFHQQWQSDARPIFERAGVATLDELNEALNQRARRLEEIREARESARALEQRVSDQRDWAKLLADYQQELAAIEKALDGVDLGALETTAHDLVVGDVPALDAKLAKLRANRPKMAESEQTSKGRLLEANALILEKQQALSVAHQELATAKQGLEGDWQKLMAGLLEQSDVLAEALEATSGELKVLVDETDKSVGEARQAHTVAERSRSAAEEGHGKLLEELRSTENRRASAEGELNILREAVSKLDEKAAKLGVETAQGELNQMSAPPTEVTESMLIEARDAVQSAQRVLREIEDEIQSKRGALRHVGGEVARERSEEAREALKVVREEERSLEIDYNGWALLRETLLEAEQEEGVHLGKVLGDPIFKRFSDLTASRYGQVTLGPDLETGTISVAGGGRPVTSLSVGTRDQLSIIFRLTLAERLSSAVVLDDQLTQSDEGRMASLRELIRHMATNTQILVFTCRPGDYLTASELKPSKRTDGRNLFVRPVDLTQLIERSGTVEGS